MRKQLKYFIASLVVMALAAVPMLPVFAQDNLLPNESVEQSTNGNPNNWRADRWGTNQANLSYASGGQDGAKSLRIDMTQYTDGDAKWMADAVSVTPDTTYTYSSYYKSNVTTEIDLQYIHQDGSVSYEFVQIVPAANDWQRVTAEFKTPATASKVVVMHVIVQTGWLQTDNFSLGIKEVVPPVGENLIGNASFESALGLDPANWNKNFWGDTTAQFAYETYGHSGSRSATVSITQHASGDAKWYAPFVNVDAGKTYTYKDFYKATRDSRVVVAYVNAAGEYSYAEVAGAPASSGWRQHEVEFTVPQGAVQASVFHLIDGVGSLTIDDVVLQAKQQQTAPSFVPNPSLEDASSATMPTGWRNNKWGTNTAAFEYVNGGRTGTKSAKVTVSNYQNGDAKWYFEPVEDLQPGKQYRFSAWYKGNVLPQAVVMYIKADGSESYFGMPQPKTVSATEWQQYSDSFTVPSDAVAVSAFLFVNQNGWLQTDDYSIAEYAPAGFDRPLLTLTFDDGHEDNADTALPLLNQYGFKTTQCYATTFIEGKASAIADVKKFQDSGHEICSHTVSHPFLTSVNAQQLQYELQHSREYLESITGVSVDNFATPYGDYNPTVNEAIKQYYGSHRTVDEGFNSKDNFDQHRLRVQNILDTTSADQVREWIAQAQADNTWLILVYHRIANDPGPYDSYTTVFREHLEVIRQSGIDVKTYKDALTEVKSQL